MPLLNCILCFVNHALLLSLCYLLLKFVVYLSTMPRWVEPMPSLIYVNPKDFTGNTYLVLHQVKLSTTNVIFEQREVNGRLYIEEVGVDLELVFMPMDLMWNLSWKLLAKYLIIWVILSVSLNWVPCRYGSDNIVLL